MRPRAAKLCDLRKAETKKENVPNRAALVPLTLLLVSNIIWLIVSIERNKSFKQLKARKAGQISQL